MYDISIDELHEKAMVIAEIALAAKKRGDRDEANRLFSEAFALEKRAAELIAPNLQAEPTRSILHQSAAYLALDCMEFREAERLVGAALAGYPQDAMADELRQLNERINFERQLFLKGRQLSDKEFQSSLTSVAMDSEIALCVGIGGSAKPELDVKKYINNYIPHIKKLIVYQSPENFDLADPTVAIRILDDLKRRLDFGKLESVRIHLFLSGMLVYSFLLGAMLGNITSVVIYQHILSEPWYKPLYEWNREKIYEKRMAIMLSEPKIFTLN